MTSLSGLEIGAFDVLTIGGVDIHALISSGGQSVYTQAEVDALLGQKVNSSTYTSGLAGKVDTSTYTAGIVAKVDTSTYTAGIAAKQDLLSNSSTGTAELLNSTTLRRIWGELALR